MSEQSVADYARDIVVDWLNKESKRMDQDMSIVRSDTFAVWTCKTLQNWKALVSTDFPGDSRYYEVTYDGENGRAYLDVYTKVTNEVVEDEQYAMAIPVE